MQFALARTLLSGGLYPTRILGLVEAGLLTPISGPTIDGFGDWLFNSLEIDRMMEKIRKRIKGIHGVQKQETINFSKVIDRLVHIGVGLPQLLNAILNGELCPCGEDQKLKGLRRLIFIERDVSKYLWACVRRSIKDSFRISEVPNILGLSLNVVYSLVKNGILPAQQKTQKGGIRKWIAKEALDSFVSTHIVLSTVASKLKTDAGFLARLLMERGVQPVLGKNISSGQRYIFKKDDLESLDLAQLVSTARERAALKRKEPQVISLEVTAEVLDVDIKTTRQLVEDGILRIYRGTQPRRELKSDICFLAETIKAYQGWARDYIGLVSAMVAAKMLGMSTSNFMEVYSRRGRIEAINPKGKSKPLYFRKKEVEALAELKRKTIIAPEAANMLGVNITCLHKLKVAGVLYPVSGPDVDGFGLNLYLRSDVEKLHSERDAFKAKRVSEGGTSRFGRPCGPNQKPVRNQVSPRIEQLVKQWSATSEGQPISGGRVHRQLVQEGYRVGINTVYVCLRELRQQAY